jgi:hypothetical protein
MSKNNNVGNLSLSTTVVTRFLLLCAVLPVLPADAATFTKFDNFAAYEAALAGLPLNTQDFEGFAHGDNLNNVEFLPGISVTSNLPKVEAFKGHLFGFGGSVREQGGAFYDINFSQPYNAVGFNIESFDPDTPGPAIIDIFFGDQMSASIDIFPTNATESDPIFFGVIADTPIARIRLGEGPEIGGSGNEEISLDDFVIAPALMAPSFTLFSNPDDPLLLKAKTVDGDVIKYFGEKNAEGFATAFNAVKVKSVTNGPTTILLDEQSRPAQILAANGVTLKINWQSDTLIQVTAISADGTIQVNVSVDLTTQKVSQPTVSTSAQAAVMDASVQRAPRGGFPVEAFTTPLNLASSIRTLIQELSPATSVVNVSRCSAPVNDALVTMRVVVPGEDIGLGILGKLTGSGVYSVSIPTRPSAGIQAQAVCESVASVLDVGCAAVEGLGPAVSPLICNSVGAAVDALLARLAVPPGKGAAIIAACEGGFKAGVAYCSAFGQPPPGGTIADLVCANIDNVVDRFVQTDASLTPFARIPGAGLFSAPSQTSPASGPFPNFTIDAGGNVEIASFTTNPVDPAPGQSYVATAEIACAAPGTEVRMSIVGTDGYTDSATCIVEGNSACNLFVPGAREGIVDTVTVTVSNGPTRNVALVF